MENFNIYEDLEKLHAEEEKNAIEDLKWKEKYTVALETIQQLQADKKELNRKIKQLETNFASLLDTARTEIKRKDKQILELRKEKDDICFRRKKHQSDKPLSDTFKDVPSEGFRVNPFWHEPRKDLDTRRVVPDKFASASKEINDDNTTKQWRTDHRQQTEKYIRENEQPRSRDYFDDRSRRRNKDRSEKQNRYRSRDCLEDRDPSKNKYAEERNDHKNKDREELPESNSRRDTSNIRDERRRDQRRDETQKTHSRDRLKTENSERSWDRKKNYTNERIKSQTSEDQKPFKNDEPKNAINSKHTQNQQIEKKGPQKIEILQIEILKDVKELKKNKLSESKNENKNPEDPEKVATEKSNQFLDALFDDAAMTNNEVEEPNDLYDDLEAVKQSDLNNIAKMDENCNVKFQTPIKQPNEKLFDDLFGPSPASSVVAVANRRSSVTSAGECSNDTVDFVRIPAKPIIPKPNEADNEKNTSPYSRSKDVIENKMVIKDSFSEKENNKNNETHETSKKDITNNTATTTKEQKSFKFVELDSSFYSSEDDECTDRRVSGSVKNSISDIESPTLENVLAVSSQNSFPSIGSDSSNAIEKPCGAVCQSKTYKVYLNGRPDVRKMTEELKTCKRSSLPIPTLENVLAVSSQNSFPSIGSDSSNAIEKPCGAGCEPKTYKVYLNGRPDVRKMTEELKTCKRSSLPIPTLENVLAVSSQNSFPSIGSDSSNAIEKPCGAGCEPKTYKVYLNGRPDVRKMTEELKTCKRSSLPILDEIMDEDKIAKRSGTSNKCKMDDEKSKHIKKVESRKEEKRSHHSPSNQPRSDAKEYNSRRRHISTKYDRRLPESDRKGKYHRHHRSKEHKSARSEKLYSVSKSYKNSPLKTMHDRKDIDSRKSVKDGVRSSPMLVWSDDNESPVKVPQRTQHSTNGLKEHQDQVIFLHCDDISDDEGDEFDIMDTQQQYNDSVPKTNDVNGESTLQDTLLMKSKAQVEQSNYENESNKNSLEFVKVQELEPKQSCEENCQDVRNEEMKNCCEVIVLGEQNDANVTNINDQPAVEMETLQCDDNVECEKSSEVAENFEEKSHSVVQNKQVEMNSEVDSQAYVYKQKTTSEGKQLIDEAKTDMPQASSNEKNNLTSCNMISQDQTQGEPGNGFVAVCNKIEEDTIATEENKNMKASSPEEPSNIEKLCSSDTGKIFAESCVDLNNSFDEIEAAVSLCDEIKTVHNDAVELQVLSAIQCETNTIHPSKEPCTVEEHDSLFIDKNKVVILSNLQDSTITGERDEKLEEKIFDKNQNPHIKAMTDSSLPLSDIEPVNGGKLDKNKSTTLKDDIDELVTNSSCENVSKDEMKDSEDCESSLPNRPIKFTENGYEDDRGLEVTTEQKILKEKMLNEASGCKTFVKEKEVTMSCEILSTSDARKTEKLLIEEIDMPSSEVESIVSNSDKATTSNEYRLETEALCSLISPQTLLKPINKPTSEDVSSGRRKKLKTPRKWPEGVTTSSSTLVRIVANRRYSKSEEGRSFYSNELVQLSMRRTQSSSDLSCLEEKAGDDKCKWDNLFRSDQPPKICSIEESPIEHNTQQLEVDDQMTRLSEEKLEHVTEKEGEKSELIKLPEETTNLKLLQVEDEVEETLTKVLGLECITKEGSEVSLGATNGDRCLMLNSETRLLKEQNESNEKIILSEGAKDFKKEDCTTRIDAATKNVANRGDEKKTDEKKETTLNCTEVKLHNDNNIENSTKLSTTDYKNISLTENICHKSKSISNSHFEDQGALRGSVVSLHEHRKLKDQKINEQDIPPSPSNDTNGCQLKKFAKPKDTAISAERRKRKTGTTFSDFDKDHDTTMKKDKPSPDSGNPKTKSKKKYKRIIQNCDSSGESDIFGDNVDHSLPTSTHYYVSKTGVNSSSHSPDLKNLKKKQNTKQIIAPSAESSNIVISKPKSPTQLLVNSMETLSHAEEILDIIHSASFSTNVTAEDAIPSFTAVERSERCSEKTSETFTDNSHSTDTSLNVSISTKIKKKSPKQKKRKLSECGEPVAHSKRSKKQCLPETNLDNCQAKPDLSTEKENNQSPSHEKSLSAALTPTHHKIFLNDVFPDNPPPVYNANEEDAQYQEIDDRLRSMFQSPTYNQASIGGECSFEQSNRNESSLNNSLTIAETLNQSNGSQCDSSTISRKVSLGSKDYVIETVGTHTANVFITRKKSKKRAKVAVAT